MVFQTRKIAIFFQTARARTHNVRVREIMFGMGWEFREKISIFESYMHTPEKEMWKRGNFSIY